MKAWICYGAAGLLGILGVMVFPGSIREGRRLSRIRHEGVRVGAEILRIEEETVSTDGDDRLRYGPSKIVETATVRYSFGGESYEARHGLPEPVRTHRPGDKLPIVLLPDDPAHGYAEFAITGNRIMSFLLSPLLLLGAAAAAGAGHLIRAASRPGP